MPANLSVKDGDEPEGDEPSRGAGGGVVARLVEYNKLVSIYLEGLARRQLLQDQIASRVAGPSARAVTFERHHIASIICYSATHAADLFPLFPGDSLRNSLNGSRAFADGFVGERGRGGGRRAAGQSSSLSAPSTAM